MARREGVVERTALGLDREAAPLDRRATLELVEGDANAGVVQPAERVLESDVANERLDVAELDPRSVEQRPIRAAQKGGLAEAELLLDAASRLRAGQWPPNEAREPPRESDGPPHVGDGGRRGMIKA